MLSVVVEVPGVGEAVAGVRVARLVPSNLTASGAVPVVGVAVATAVGGWLAGGEADPADRAAVEVGVEEVAARPDLEVDRVGGARGEGAVRAGSGTPLAPGSIAQMQSRE